mgnify:CR=1 FL=1
MAGWLKQVGWDKDFAVRLLGIFTLWGFAVAQPIYSVLVDNTASHAQMMEFAASFMPGSNTSIELYQGARPIFDLHGVEEEISRALLSDSSWDSHARAAACCAAG